MILQASLSDQIAGWFPSLGAVLFCLVVWGLVFAGTGLFIGAFIPFITGDSLVFAAGLVSASSEINIWVMAGGVGVAAWLGDQVGYTLGRHYGRPYLDKRKGTWIRTGIEKSEKLFQAWGWWAIVIARFVPWARVFVPAIAGIARMNYYKFFSANLVGALAWGTGLTLAGYYSASIPAVKNASYLIAGLFITASIVAGIRVWLRNRRVK
ncbi:MAG: DedA family protein [Acidobacteria bacterium]|nr:DedA family protein [Acidobacteriota bacterium]